MSVVVNTLRSTSPAGYFRVALGIAIALMSLGFLAVPSVWQDLASGPSQAQNAPAQNGDGLPAAAATQPPPNPTGGPGAMVYHYRYSEPVDLYIFVSCANGAGETVYFTGTVEFTGQYTTDARGGLHYKATYTYRNLAGTGLTTGAQYSGSGSGDYSFNGRVGEQYTVISSFKAQSATGVRFTTTQKFHITVNANGQATSSHFSDDVSCR